MIDNFIKAREILVSSYPEGDKDTKREGRVFFIRFLLSLDLSVSIGNEYSLTKTKAVKDCYCQIYRLLDMWTVYEALLQYAESLGLKNEDDHSRYNWIAACGTEISESIDGCAMDGIEYLRSLNDEISKFGLESYFYHLEQQAESRSLQKNVHNMWNIVSMRPNIFDRKIFLDLIYAERCAYFHNGDCVRMSTDYSIRFKMLTKYYETLKEVIIRLGEFCFMYETHEHQ